MDKWKSLESQLQGMFCEVKAQVEGYELEFKKQLDGEKLVVSVFVNGWIKGAWASVDPEGNPKHPEGRFWCPKKMRVWPKKRYAELKRIYGKKKADHMTALRVSCVLPAFSSPRALTAFYRKHFPELQFVCQNCGETYEVSCQACTAEQVGQ
ncbi:hypothetical protein DFO83_101294 [Idiomarina loihiensis]|uniref:hypothetical protein n=1 Tax=Idiomarina TaxID=135575 RepID=UPI000D708FD3|nr:hypothetical protein [Idiomarina]PWW41602.1 hypothetical protein DFO83_101294 [Idiomarina loihiensis]TDP50660.1 hypothetical protein DET58_101294 [Idiomarina loihiensis]TDS25062.1 hypothetical protein DET62_101145 [Idiomarina sp. H2]